jgi:hypothetical protein
MEVHGEIWQSLEGPAVGVEVGLWRLGGVVRALAGFVECNESG